MKAQIFAIVLIVLVGTVNADPGFGFIKKMIKKAVQYLHAPSEKTVDGKPAFCGNYDCPSFNVINKTDDYELRCYDKVYWVSTTSSGTRKFTLCLYVYARPSERLFVNFLVKYFSASWIGFCFLNLWYNWR